MRPSSSLRISSTQIVALVWFGLAMITAFSVIGCSRSELPRALRLALNPWPGYSFAYLAEEKGFFEEEGISVQIIELGSLADSRRIFEQRQADITCCTLVEVLLMNDSNHADPVRIVSAVDYSNGSDMLLGRCEVESLDSLAGCRIGVEPESVDGLSVFLALTSVGLTLDDVTLVPLAQSEMVEAMRTGRVDAVQTYPPTSDWVQQQEGVHRLWDSSQTPATILDVMAARESLLLERSEEVRAFVRAYDRAQKYFLQHNADYGSPLRTERRGAAAILRGDSGIGQRRSRSGKSL
jgi:NitT/TauT family transport system substrate-binding protein